MTASGTPQQWWITTGILTLGGEKILGPFATQELALVVRSYVEKVKGTTRLWVDSEDAPGLRDQLTEALDGFYLEVAREGSRVHGQVADPAEVADVLCATLGRIAAGSERHARS